MLVDGKDIDYKKGLEFFSLSLTVYSFQCFSYSIKFPTNVNAPFYTTPAGIALTICNLTLTYAIATLIFPDRLSQNAYSYVENDPVNYIDPSGHTSVNLVRPPNSVAATI